MYATKYCETIYRRQESIYARPASPQPDKGNRGLFILPACAQVDNVVGGKSKNFNSMCKVYPETRLIPSTQSQGNKKK